MNTKIDGEKIVGEVNDPRLRALLSLGEEAMREINKIMPESVRSFPEGSQEGFDAFQRWARDQKISDLEHLAAAATGLKDLRNLSDELFWRGVRDTLPAVTNLKSISLREGWKIVETEVDSNPFGDISPELRRAILESLAGALG